MHLLQDTQTPSRRAAARQQHPQPATKLLVAVASGPTEAKLQTFFRARHQTVTFCHDLASAGHALQEGAHPLALIDLDLDADALALCRQLRALPGGEDTHILVFPRAETPEHIRAALEAGADDYLIKPFTSEALQLRLVIAERSSAARRHRHLDERRLAHSAQRYRTLIETMHEGLFEVDAEGHIVFANSRFSEITGYEQDDLLGTQADALLIHPKVRDRLPEQSLLGAATVSEEYALPLMGKARQEVWVKLTGAPVTTLDGAPGGSIGVVEDLTATRQAEQALRHREAFFRALWENASDLVTLLDIEGRVLHQSAASSRLLGVEAEDLVGRELTALIHEEDHPAFLSALEHVLEGGDTHPPIEVRMRHRDGIWRDLECLFNNMIDDPVVGGIVVTSRDRTDRKRIEDLLKRERAFFRQLFRNSPTAIVILDNNDQVVEVNHAFEALFQYTVEEMEGSSLNARIVPDDLRDEAEQLSQSVLRRDTIERETVRQRRDGSKVDVAILAYPIEIQHRQLGAYALYSDITQRKRAERKLFYEAFHDALTGLPNRTLLKERLTLALRRTRRGDFRFALLFIDLDRFKVINDSLGHAAGDALLEEMARRLLACVRPGDTVARLGGDEFTILLSDLFQPNDTALIAERVLTALRAPVQIEGQEVVCSGSIGIALSDSGYQAADDMIRDADIAMYRAKTRGKANYEVFDTAMHRSAVERLRLETELRRAIDLGELMLYFQPIISLPRRRTVGFEALVRWDHVREGLLAPGRFIPLAEETGLILPLGRWVLAAACQRAVDWQARFPDSDCIQINVNISVREISHPDFLSGVERIIDDTGINPAAIVLEITESLMMEAADELSDVLWQLRNLGFRMAIDDFGTGYSSLSSLHTFPLDTLKIDRSFTQRLEPGGEDVDIVRAIGALADSLHLTVIAEGVENEAQLSELRKLGLRYAQGYWFSRPVDADQAERMIAKDRVWR